MPATSKKQERFMGMCANSPGRARGKCPSRAVAREFAHGPVKAGAKLKGLHKFQRVGK